MKITRPKITEYDWELFNHLLDLEKERRRSLPRLTDKEWLGIFPEAKTIIPKKIKEWEERRDEIFRTIKKKLRAIRRYIVGELARWIWREWVKATDGEELLEADRHIASLKRLQWIASGRVPRGRIAEEQIQQAVAVPIETLLKQPMRKSGKALVGLCPFHAEKHPSFLIYLETNSCWCFGCNKGGDVINFVRLLHGFSFPDAVKWLCQV